MKIGDKAKIIENDDNIHCFNVGEYVIIYDINNEGILCKLSNDLDIVDTVEAYQIKLLSDLYVIEIRLVAQSETGLVAKKQKTLVFDDEETTRNWCKENLDNSKYIASYTILTTALAILRKHEIIL